METAQQVLLVTTPCPRKTSLLFRLRWGTCVCPASLARAAQEQHAHTRPPGLSQGWSYTGTSEPPNGAMPRRDRKPRSASEVFTSLRPRVFSLALILLTTRLAPQEKICTGILERVSAYQLTTCVWPSKELKSPGQRQSGYRPY